MALWDTRYCDDKFGLETKASFQYFTEYLQQDYPRSIKILAENINAKKVQQGKRQIRKNTFYDYSRKWKWKMREQAYDDYLRTLHYQNKEKEIMEWESEQLQYAKQRSNIHNDTLQQIHNADKEEFPLNKKVYAESQNQEAYNKSIDGIYTILHGGIEKRENNNTGTEDVTLHQQIQAQITTKQVLEDNEDTIREFINTTTNPDD